jgi:hypothetical protein
LLAVHTADLDAQSCGAFPRSDTQTTIGKPVSAGRKFAIGYGSS